MERNCLQGCSSLSALPRTNQFKVSVVPQKRAASRRGPEGLQWCPEVPSLPQLVQVMYAAQSPSRNSALGRPRTTEHTSGFHPATNQHWTIHTTHSSIPVWRRLPSQIFQRQGSMVHRTGRYFLLSVGKAWSLSPQGCSLPLPVYGHKPSSLSTGHAVDGLASGDWLALHTLTKSWILNTAYGSKSVSSCGVPCWASLSSRVKIIWLAGRYNAT